MCVAVKMPMLYEWAIVSGIMWIIVGLSINEMPWRAIIFAFGFVMMIYGIWIMPDKKLEVKKNE